MTIINENPNGEIAQSVEPDRAVEPERSPLRWLWWLLGLIILGLLVWAIVHACTGTDTEIIEAVPPIATIDPTDAPPVDVIDGVDNISVAQTAIDDLRSSVEQENADLAAMIDDGNWRTGFEQLCLDSLNRRITTAEDIANFFGLTTLADDEATYLTGLVDESWCNRL
ncbi:MAG: hypothetical protein FWG25_09530 [Promicromonosporaceae bacterium]|nr:hypothetical protein [Promicromonosporaceae bacterium]